MFNLSCLENLLTCPISPVSKRVVVWFAVASAVGFSAMGYDNSRAASGEWRVSEKTLWELDFRSPTTAMALPSQTSNATIPLTTVR